MYFTNTTHYTSIVCPSHLIMIATLIVFLITINIYRNFFRRPKIDLYFRIIFITILFLTIIFEQTWHIYHEYKLATSLPLSICTLSSFLAIWLLIKKSHFPFDLLFFSGAGGASVAILMAKLKYAFPHLLFFTYYAKHICIVIVPIYMIIVHRFYPTWLSYKRSLYIFICQIPIILFINHATEGNYWYIMKPLRKYTTIDILPNSPFRFLIITTLYILYFSFYFVIATKFFNYLRTKKQKNKIIKKIFFNNA